MPFPRFGPVCLTASGLVAQVRTPLVPPHVNAPGSEPGGCDVGRSHDFAGSVAAAAVWITTTFGTCDSGGCQAPAKHESIRTLKAARGNSPMTPSSCCSSKIGERPMTLMARTELDREEVSMPVVCSVIAGTPQWNPAGRSGGGAPVHATPCPLRKSTTSLHGTGCSGLVSCV